MDAAALAPLRDAGVELLLVGCGKMMQAVPLEMRNYCRSIGVAMEPMDTGAACRTYNVLMAEDRKVAALLMPV